MNEQEILLAEEFVRTGKIKTACEAAGISRISFWKKMKTNKEFAEFVDTLGESSKAAALKNVTAAAERLSDIAIGFAEGSIKNVVPARKDMLIYLLKVAGMNPDKPQEQPQRDGEPLNADEVKSLLSHLKPEVEHLQLLTTTLKK